MINIVVCELAGENGGREMTRLYIVRHGETDWNKKRRVQGHSDIPLNEYGIHLAKETAEGLKDTRFDVAYTSPLKRARQTAQIILGERKIPLYEEERVKEMGFGEYEGLCCAGQNKDEKSEELIQSWSLATTNDLKDLEDRFDKTTQSVDDLEKSFKKFKKSSKAFQKETEEKLEEIDKRIKSLEDN